jgi:hypothetical protein
MLKDDTDASAFNPPDADRVYENYSENVQAPGRRGDTTFVPPFDD